jgi:hypothetical protein
MQNFPRHSFLIASKRDTERIVGRARFMQAVLDQELIADSLVWGDEDSLGEKIGFLSNIFGCWHKRMSRPVTRNDVTFRSCINCGARRKFDMESFRTSGPFYYPPTVKADPFRKVT